VRVVTEPRPSFIIRGEGAIVQRSHHFTVKAVTRPYRPVGLIAEDKPWRTKRKSGRLGRRANVPKDSVRPDSNYGNPTAFPGERWKTVQDSHQTVPRPQGFARTGSVEEAMIMIQMAKYRKRKELSIKKQFTDRK